MFLWVQENKITNIMALQPIGQRSVFDQRGAYLGQGGFELDPIQATQQAPVDIVTAIKKATPPKPEESSVSDLIDELRKVPMPKESVALSDLVEETNEGEDTELIDEMLTELQNEMDPDPAPLVHKFHLRPDFELELPLPMDLTEREAERLATFILSCPFWREG